MSKKTWWKRRTATMRGAIASAMIASLIGLAGTLGAVIIPPLIGNKKAAVEIKSVVVREDVDTVAMEFTVYNAGGSRGLITAAKFVVQDYMLLPACATGGDIPISSTYDLILPPMVEVGQVFQIPLSQQTAADEADRFAVRAQLSDKPETIAWPFYRLAVSFEIDGGQEYLDAGNVMFALPNAPIPAGMGSYWGQDHYMNLEESLYYLNEEEREAVKACMQSNSQNLRDFFDAEGNRPNEFEVIEADLE